MKRNPSNRASNLEETGRRIGRQLGETQRRFQKELQQVIDYLDKEIVPTVRDESSRSLRVAADKLSKLADLMDQQRRQKP